MLIQPDCIPCILTMSIAAIRRLSLDDTIAKNLFSDILTIPGLRGLEWNQTSPDIIEVVMKKISAAVKDPDPFFEEKTDLNNRVLKIYPFVNKLVEKASEPFYTAAKISILGNSIDFMMPGVLPPTKILLSKSLKPLFQKMNSQCLLNNF
ncbi:MAG: ARMT1-like domain-containing protein [Desulfobacula sp.]|nr:ARMT1-like domain-containing protein [Desulfobacula sp.]